LEQNIDIVKIKNSLLSLLRNTYKSIDKVKKVYLHDFNGVMMFYVVLRMRKYNAKVMADLNQVEYDIISKPIYELLELDFLYLPSHADKQDEMHPDADVIYIQDNIGVPDQTEEEN
jgi:hypothetical protein